MKHLKTLLVVTAMAVGTAVPAQAQLFGGLDNNTILGGGAGAGLGALIGREIAPRGNNTEGAAIGALVGGLAGASFGNQQSQFAGNPFAGQFNPGFNGRSLVGTGAGAVLGGAIGSNLAGSGVREEGTAIGALIGGAAGYALSNRGQAQQFAGQPQFIGQQFQGQQFQGQPQFVGQPVSAPIVYGAQPSYAVQTYTAPTQQVIYSQPQFTAPQTSTVYAAPPARPLVQHQASLAPNITYASPSLRLAGPEIRERVVYSGVTHVEHMPIARAEHYVAPPRVVYQSPHIATQHVTTQKIVTPQYRPQSSAPLCYAGSSKRYDSWGNAINATPTCR